MNCKFCNAEMEEGLTLCPECGKENQEVPAEETAVEPAQEEVASEEVPAEETAVEPVQEEMASGETPAEETQEEKPAKKTALWKIILAVAAGLVLVAVLVGAVLYGTGALSKADSYTVSDAKAEKARDTVVATVGDVELTNSQLQVYYWQSVNDFVQYYGYYLDVATLGLDLNAPLDQQYQNEEEGITWQQYFLENALTVWSRYAALTMHAREAGFALSEESQAYLESLADQLDQMAVMYGYADAETMLQEDMSAACDRKGYMGFLELNFYTAQYLESIYDQLAPTMEELEAYYNENTESLNAMGIVRDGSKTVDVRHILICPDSDTDGNITEAQWEACREEAQKLMDKWAAEDGTEEGFAQYAAEYTEDPGSQSTGGLYTDVYEGKMVTEFEDWCFAQGRTHGDYGLVKTIYGYHIMFFVAEEEVWASNLTSTIITERSTALVEEAMVKWPKDVNYKKIVLGEAALQ